MASPSTSIVMMLAEHSQLQTCAVRPGSVEEELLLRPYDSISACDVRVYYTTWSTHPTLMNASSVFKLHQQ